MKDIKYVDLLIIVLFILSLLIVFVFGMIKLKEDLLESRSEAALKADTALMRRPIL